MSGRSREPQKKVVTKTVSQKTFVFGSSTPRDLSHMNKIPLKLRSYDVKEKHRSAGPPLREYMEKARCLSRNGSSDGRNWAFGSSTPRDFSHLTRVDPKFRRYDAIIPREKGYNTVVGSFVRRSITAPPSNRASQFDEPPKQPTQSKIKKEDDASSEPDFVQDRAEFLQELKKGIKERDEKEKAQKADNSSVKMDEIQVPHLHNKRLSVGETSEISYSQATDLADVINCNERIPHNFHEEEARTAKRESVQGLSDQITVSELNETLEELNLSSRRHTPPMVQNILQKVESISETSQIDDESVTASTDICDAEDKSKKSFDGLIQTGVETVKNFDGTLKS